ncbi:restriction endonuclease subunit S [Prevotella disiens]|uniref:restriction endonuclease subunit S n=1 Tax=Prevotella disiens TaxID=28130 RepID=UPI0015F34BEC|nr:restriction endonuclease subunit S [Prevotella disiens]
MEEWKEYKLEEVCSRLRSGKGIKSDCISNTGLFPVIGGNGMRGYTNKSNFKGECAVIGRQGANCGNVRFFMGEAYMTEHAVVAVGNELADSYFLARLLSLMHLGNLSAQSAQPGLSIQTLSKQVIRLPSISYQREISTVLKSLDDKIELNRRINDNLEQQAQALFKSWFVDFEPFKEGKFVDSELGRIPEGWRVERLGSVCKCLLGGTPSRNKEEYWNGKIAWINSGEINEFRITKPSEYITQEGLKKSATKLLPKKTTVLAITGATLGQVSLLEIDSCANQSVIGLLENEDIFHEYIYPLIKNRIDDLCSHMTGGAQQHINKNNVEQLEILVPPKKILVEYKQIATPIYSLISNICFESQKISKLRDSLLPRLMSGELKLDKINN